MSFHYKYGGSTAKRTMKCHGWRALADSLNTVDKSSAAANRGTMLHTCCEILENEPDTDFTDLLERDISYEGEALTEELLEDKVIPAMEALDTLIEDHGLTTIITEELLEFDEHIGGTPDLLCHSDTVIACADYKFGDGLMVYADDNDQMFFCVWLALECGIFDIMDYTDDTPVVFAIIQPSDKREETLDVWKTDVRTVEDFGGRFLEAVEIAENTTPGENLSSGDWCSFCPAEGMCPEKLGKATSALKLLDAMALKNKDTDLTIPVLDLNTALNLADELGPWIKAVRSFAFDQLEAGAKGLEWKLVPKRATRRWVDEAATTRYLKRKLKSEHAMVSTVISPAQAEKVAKKLKIKIRMEGLTSSKSSGTTLVRLSDKREAVTNKALISDALKQLENKT